jgi:ParB family transcriptional regulator, chromosome partitioning protein
MGIRDKLEAKNRGGGIATELLERGATRAAPPARAPGARTAPGQLMEAMLSADEETQALREKVEQLEGAHPVVRLNSREVRPSRFANRHAASFETQAFREFRDEIQSAGGNIEAIQVRRLEKEEVDGAKYEIAFGHRRHRACLELELPVLAIVVQCSDIELFAAMDRENRGRQDLSPWEAGKHWQRALDMGLWKSQNEMAAHLGLDKSLISRARLLAGLPDEVVAAFPSPLDLVYRWADPLNVAIEKSRENVLRRALELAGEAPKLGAEEVFKALTGTAAKPRKTHQEMRVDGERVGTITAQSDRVTVSFGKGVLPSKRIRELCGVLEDFLAKPDK